MKDELDAKRWELFKQICDKTDLDLRGESLKEYKPNFKSAFLKAHNVANFYIHMRNVTENMEDKDNDD